MKVKDLFDKLADFNLEAEVNVIAPNQSYDFSICWGGNSDAEGTPKEDTSGVNFYVDELCQSEREG